MTQPQRFSAAMPGTLDTALRHRLLRDDGQEDICLVTYAPSTGATRTSALVREIVPPEPAERAVHGNASFTGDYVVRAASLAAEQGLGIALAHSHPRGTGWQQMSGPDEDAERSFAHLAHAITGHDLFGMTLAGNRAWSARRWSAGAHSTEAESVRVVDSRLRVTWNDALRPVPTPQDSQIRTISGWGEQTQGALARLRVLIVGAGSIGHDIAIRLAATGLVHVAVMDFDDLERVNLDRMPTATQIDIALRRSKTEHALRQLRLAATAGNPDLHGFENSICEDLGQRIALDYDVIFSCVDRPWPRAVLNQLAYSDLIPVIDGGIAIDAFADGNGMRNATWRSHVLRPGRPCMVCTRQLDPAEVTLDQQGLLEDPEYIRQSERQESARQNVAALALSPAASQLAQFISLTVAPGGLGEPGPLQYVLSTHHLMALPTPLNAECFFEQTTGLGDARVELTNTHEAAERTRDARRRAQRTTRVRIARAGDMLLTSAQHKWAAMTCPAPPH
ncbi:ThiF family adenylyltransferase [Actinomadura sp. WAC 06369]|uniref:ThiF family adenylyltransferase n=1 Tax=Actinomadura sp. WAC 06369 TaxID=2203193 RepID=UPI0013150F75|nr:ThiF family adenylyltransferase [Actinomadura sp. WAC 06369]